MTYCTVNDVLRRFGLNETTLPKGWGLGISDITAFIEKNQSTIDDLYNGTFDQTTYTDEYHDAPGRDNELVTENRPIVSVTSMYRKSGSTWVPLSNETSSRDDSVSDSFQIRDSEAGIIKVVPNYAHPGYTYGDEYAAYDDMYKITYAAGYPTVPSWVERLCTDMTQRDVILVLRHNGSTEAKDILDAYRDTYKLLTQEIDEGKKKLRRHRKPAVGVL